MTTKWKVLTSIMTILVAFCACFTTVYIQHSKKSLEQFITLSSQNIQSIANVVQQQTSSHYQKRIKSFLNYHASPARTEIIQAFKQHDRETLLKATTPFLQLFKKETPCFSTFSWILPDNTSFLLVHNPAKFGMNVSKFRPDIVSVNKDLIQHAGFSASPVGLQYRVVNPVIYEGKHYGALQFGLRDSCFIDAIHTKLNLPVGLVIPEHYAKYITKSKLPTIVGPDYTIQSRQIALFKNDNTSIDWSLDRQRQTLNGKEYIILKVVQLNNYQGTPVGHIFTALDISEKVAATKSDILFVITLSGMLILVSFLILYFSYSALTQKIMDLRIVEDVNRQLEARVAERTQTLEERESYLKTIFNAPNEAIFVHDAQTGKILEVNQAMLDMFEISIDHALSATPNELSLNKPPYSEEEAMEKMRLAASGQPQTFEWLAKKGNGELFWVEVGLKRAMIHDQSLVIAVVRNIDAKKKAEKQLKLFKTFAEASNQGMGWVDINGKLHYANATLVEILGEKSLNSPLGKDVTSYYLPEERNRLWNLILPLVISKGEWSGELQVKQRDGTIIPTFNSMFLIHNENNEPQFIGNIVTDISKEKASAQEKEQLTEKLHQAKKMESIGLMAGGVAHDLNNILSGIVSYPELLLNKLPKESELRQPIEAIHSSGQRAAVIVADLLTVARGVASIKQNNDLHTLVQEYLRSPESKQLQAHYPKIDVTTLFNAKRSTISCSAVHIKKCIMNLVTNASEAIADEGSVLLSTRNSYLDELSASQQGLVAGEYVILRVEDSGPGIPNSDLQHIFEPFYTRKVMGRSGTGLGLTVVWNTMEDHHGQVIVESSDKGTTFKLFFPLDEESLPAPSEEKDNTEITGNGESILVVDDESQLRDIAKQILQSLEYTVYTADSGEQAIEFVKEAPVDLLLIDMLMEPGLNGRETYEAVQELYPEQKALIVSGFSESQDVTAAIQLGAHGFIKKPYSIKQLGLAVKKALETHS